jgi:hypothetical protein
MIPHIIEVAVAQFLIRRDCFSLQKFRRLAIRRSSDSGPFVQLALFIRDAKRSDTLDNNPEVQ